MAISFISVGAAVQTASGTTLTPVIPTHNAGDLLVAIIYVSGQTQGNPAGWTLLDGAGDIGGVYSLIATGSDANPVFSWTTAAAATAQVAVFRNVNATLPLTYENAAQGTTTPATAASFNSAYANSWALVVVV